MLLPVEVEVVGHDDTARRRTDKLSRDADEPSAATSPSPPILLLLLLLLFLLLLAHADDLTDGEHIHARRPLFERTQAAHRGGH